MFMYSVQPRPGHMKKKEGAIVHGIRTFGPWNIHPILNSSS